MIKSYHKISTTVVLVLFLVVIGAGQSGRRKEQTTKPAKPKPSPIADPTRSERTSVSAQPSPSPKSNDPDEIDESDILRISSNLVPIPATVLDQRGVAITDLKLSDFELLVDGQVRPVSEMSRTETPVRMVMLFDNSGSLDFAREFEKRAAIEFFRRVLRKTDEAAIYSVESDSYLAQPLTNDFFRLEQTILSFGKPAGSTSLFDAIIDSTAYLRPYGGRRVLVIVSDGVETTSRADFAQTNQQVLAGDVQIFVVQTGLYDGANLRALAAERRMEELANQTGGAVFIPKTTADLDHAFEQIAADLAHQYILSYYAGDQPRDGRFHSIQLRVKERKQIRIRTRKGYYSRKPANLSADW